MDATPLSISTFDLALPHGITLSCRACGSTDAPRLLFLHGFPEAAFVWDEVMLRLGQHYRCIAPNLRGYERSSAPEGPAAYRVKHLIGDITALVDQLGGSGRGDGGARLGWRGGVELCGAAS
jgi:pimeloyl-ACP methyl ester carboxylesterase